MDARFDVKLNEAQRRSVGWYFDTDNKDGEPWPLEDPVEIGVDRGQLVINLCYLHTNGSWATFHESDGPGGPNAEVEPSEHTLWIKATVIATDKAQATERLADLLESEPPERGVKDFAIYEGRLLDDEPLIERENHDVEVVNG